MNETGTLWLRDYQSSEVTYSCEIGFSDLPLTENEFSKIEQDKKARTERIEKRKKELKKAEAANSNGSV